MLLADGTLARKLLVVGDEFSGYQNAETGDQTSSGAALANRAYYIPFTIPGIFTVTHMAWGNAATVTGNVDVGIYDEQGALLTSSGATAKSGTTSIQVVSVTSITLQPGRYYVAYSQSLATSTTHAFSGIVRSKSSGVQEQASAHPLPATATFAVATDGTIPVVSLAHGSTFLK